MPIFSCGDAQGSGTSEFIRDMQKYFTKVARMRVDASRSMSREFYAVGLGRKPPTKMADDVLRKLGQDRGGQGEA